MPDLIPETNSSPPSTPLSRGRILAVAMTLVDQGGLQALSMRRLAQALGVKAMSLYNHIANKDDLIDSLVDQVVSEIELPSLEIAWKTALRQRAISAHSVLLRHPWAALALMSRINVGPAMLRYIDATLGCLVDAGFTYEMADHAWNAIDSYLYGFTLQALNFPLDPANYSEAASSFVPNLPVDQYPYMNHLTHLVIEKRYNGLHDFEFGLDLILNGLEPWRVQS
ncbi:TetR/AcrR family transcriptional regulator C-terminal domain-containing protein [Nodosilinea sp. LEGE 07298]|uniref:TetR/AcrR family transcriptional regulator C-terminal domain-containing protein n=1 Tax=Nodosilinea sp. LEGE 07298 TaxID=2777970 RepID=UPI0018802AA9|nr:TetR/AcrR family transcriptional regulator C-terminal domain-containing protein [Nodosilinea sp. LEGE 07298]